jgi:hypothetical protein
MIEKIEWKMVPSRRLFSRLGMAAALNLAVFVNGR